MNDDPHGIMGWLEKPREFQAAVEFTAAETGFVPALIEKDFWCSAVLWRLFSGDDCPLVFKGGTLLSKAYVVFNRLSEDLDFTLPTAEGTGRGLRRKRAEEIATLVTTATACLPLSWGEWRSFNLSSQHQVVGEYDSVFGGKGTIKLEVGQKEKPVRPVGAVGLSTLLLDPLFSEEAVRRFEVAALDKTEAYAEKVRAALTRREPAPRDLYDLHHAVDSGVLDWRDGVFLKLAAEKIAGEPEENWLADERMEAFRQKLEPELRPVLRPEVYDGFDFPGALETLRAVAEAVRSHLTGP